MVKPLKGSSVPVGHVVVNVREQGINIMYETCPKCQHKRQPEDTADTGVCPACGLIFSKWMKQQFAAPSVEVSSDTDKDDQDGWLQLIVEHLFYVDPKTEPVYFYSRLLLYVLFVFWGWQFIMMDYTINPPPAGNSFMHNINLVFHEAGHVIFRLFGWFMGILGGSLAQLLMPVIVVVVFIVSSNDTFAASIGLWWLGQSFMDLAPYINDALKQELVLLGGRTGADAPGNHDWNNILGELNRLEKCYDYAAYANNTGITIMLLAFAWGGYILYLQYQNMK